VKMSAPERSFLYGCWCASLLYAWFALPAGAQLDYGHRLGQRVGERLVYPASGAEVLMEAIEPTIMRSHLPQELFVEYGRRQWQYTNYAREPYRRYLSLLQEGSPFFDAYGNYITRGWLVANAILAITFSTRSVRSRRNSAACPSTPPRWPRRSTASSS